MRKVISKDGTQIAYDKTGQGPALIIVAGAFQGRMAMAAYAEPLLKSFTVYNYDRRGRGAWLTYHEPSRLRTTFCRR